MNLMFFLVMWVANTTTPTVKFYSQHETMKECSALLDKIDVEPEYKKQLKCLPIVVGLPPDAVEI